MKRKDKHKRTLLIIGFIALMFSNVYAKRMTIGPQLGYYKARSTDKSKWQEFKTNFKNDMDAIGKTMTDLFSGTD